MIEKRVKTVFCGAFLAFLVLPLLFVNLKPAQRSKAENRKLAEMPKLRLEDGSLNRTFTSDVGSWIDDRIGFRNAFVTQNALLQYHLFGLLSDHDDFYLGTDGSLAYATDEIIKDYQRFDLKTDGELRTIADSFQRVKDYAEDRGAQFYYFQCWDKQTIYPSSFPAHIMQYGAESKTDQVIRALKEQTDVDVIDPKEALIRGKAKYPTYSFWGDATHWSRRGAFIGYQQLMTEINRRQSGRYRVLTESDYDLSFTDQGMTLFGGIHRPDLLESFRLKDPKAYRTDEAPLYLSQWQKNSRTIYRNDSAGNGDTLLVIGDSYFDNFLIDDLAESFHKTVMIWGDYIQYLPEMMDAYHPAVVVCENAERCDRTGRMMKVAERIRGSETS